MDRDMTSEEQRVKRMLDPTGEYVEWVELDATDRGRMLLTDALHDLVCLITEQTCDPEKDDLVVAIADYLDRDVPSYDDACVWSATRSRLP